MEPPLSSLDVDGVATYLIAHPQAKVAVLLGAGVSVAAGIPDFRTPGTGLYAKVKEYGLENPESLFSLPFIRKQPERFYEIATAMKLWPGALRPTAVHAFVRLLADRGMLSQCFTQNIDCLERLAGVPEDHLVEAHGTFATARCMDCRAAADAAAVQETAKSGSVPRCTACDGIVKPDVVFFGESLPQRFHEEAPLLANAELLIVIGTSLKVYPFAMLPELAPRTIPRVLINMEKAGSFDFRPDGVEGLYHPIDVADGKEEEVEQLRVPYRDVFLQGDCQARVRELCAKWGVGSELQKIEESFKPQQPRTATSDL